MSNYYVKADLIDHADTDAIALYEAKNTLCRRSDIVREGLGLDSEEIQHYTTGGYQGTHLYAFEVGGYVWLLRDSYGSCSYCDGLLAAKNAASYAESMFNNAYAFKDVNDAMRFLQQVLTATEKDEHELDLNPYFWERVAKQGIGMLTELHEQGGSDE